MSKTNTGRKICTLNEFPNYKNSKTLAFCLNVMGISEQLHGNYRDSNALKKATLNWMKKHYLKLNDQNPTIAKECLINGLTLDEKRKQLVKTYPADGIRTQPQFVVLNLL